MLRHARAHKASPASCDLLKQNQKINPAHTPAPHRRSCAAGGAQSEIHRLPPPPSPLTTTSQSISTDPSSAQSV